MPGRAQDGPGIQQLARLQPGRSGYVYAHPCTAEGVELTEENGQRTNDDRTIDDPSVRPADPATVFEALSRILYESSDPAEMYAAICVTATMLVPGCDHASIMLQRRGEPVTVAASDSIAMEVDDLERQTGEGPCLDVLDFAGVVIEPDLRNPHSWPNLSKLVIEKTPVRGSLGFRLLVDGSKVGALNMFSDTPGIFDEAIARDAIVLASFASVAVAAITHGEEASTLRRGLDSNREIGKAVGLLMALHKVSDEEAFDMLRRTSQRMNRKVADLARQVVEEHAPGPDEPI
ncbi:MAG: GAF and ANTAR domain-containing protein [Aldersonia sp.]|nr:GAF and ANTAR domain-containing protein [Aldersonia sp.]